MLSLLRRQILWSLALLCLTLTIFSHAVVSQNAVVSQKIQQDAIQNEFNLLALTNDLELNYVYEDTLSIKAIADASDEHEISERSKDDTKHAFILNLYEAISDEIGEMPNDSEVYISIRTHRLQLERSPPSLI